MSQNTSHAVMQQRHEAHDSLDDFPTPPWAGRALCEHAMPKNIQHETLWEPAANRGYLLRGLRSYFREYAASDIYDYGCGYPVSDFLFSNRQECDWIITNPPFRLAAGFVLHGLKLARHGVAMLVRTSFLEGRDRHSTLFSRRKPWRVAQFSERVPMVKGRCDGKASTATSYCWLIWTQSAGCRTELVWIPPCRKKLEREGDYA